MIYLRITSYMYAESNAVATECGSVMSNIKGEK